jgi:hypothetical protein
MCLNAYLTPAEMAVYERSYKAPNEIQEVLITLAQERRKNVHLRMLVTRLNGHPPPSPSPGRTLPDVRR